MHHHAIVALGMYRYHIVFIKVFQDGQMVDMASKKYMSRCTVSYTALQKKTDLDFQLTLS